MATTEDFYTAGVAPSSSGQTSFGFSFPILQNSDLKVELDGVLKTENTSGTNNDYSISNTNVVFNTAPADNVDIHFYRVTNVDTVAPVFVSGSAIRAQDLNAIADKTFYSAQEQQQKVRTADVRDNAVTTIKIKDLAVTRPKIANDAIDGTKIADNSINSEHIVNNSIDLAHMSANSVDSNQYVDGSIDLIHMSPNSVDSDQYVDGSIDLVHMSANSVDSDQYVDGSIDLIHMSANSVDSDQYVDGSIDHIHLSNDCVNQDNIQDDSVRSEHIQADAVTDSEIATGTLDNRYYTETELDAGQLDNRYYTETETENLFLRQDSSETIASGVTWSSNDTKVATTAAIDARIIDLIEEVGGFVHVANENSFPAANPDINNAAGTIVSVQSASTTLTPTGTTVTIANGAGVGENVTLTGVPAAIPSGFGFLVETTSTLHTYTFHRLVAKATEVNTTAQNIAQIVACGNNLLSIENFADLYQVSTSAPTTRADGGNLTTGDLWFDSSSNQVMMVYDGSAGDGFSPITPSQSTITAINSVSGHITYQEDLGLITEAVNTGSGNNSINTVGADITNVNTVATNIANVNTTAGSIANVNLTGNSISNVNTVGASIADVNRYANEYKIQTGTPSGPTAGDLWFNTTANLLNYYTGSTWVGISPGIAGLINDANPALANHLDCNDKNLTEVGTVSGNNLQIDFGTL